MYLGGELQHPHLEIVNNYGGHEHRLDLLFGPLFVRERDYCTCQLSLHFGAIFNGDDGFLVGMSRPLACHVSTRLQLV